MNACRLSVIMHAKHLVQCLTKSNLPISADSNNNAAAAESMVTMTHRRHDLL